MTAPTKPRTTPAPAPGTLPPPPTRRPSTIDVMKAAISRGLEGTPGRMRLYGGIAIVACLLFGFLGYFGLHSRANALESARDDAAQLVRIQTIRTSLVSADANLTNAFLVGGLEPTAQREAYSKGIERASKTLAEAAGADADDAKALAGVNDNITEYTGLVEAARANNRQGYPVGAAYLRQATTLLRDDILPVLANLVKDAQGRVDDAYDSSSNALVYLLVGAAIALVALFITLFWLASKTRRWINVPIAIAGAIVLGASVIGVGAMAFAQSKADDVRTGAYKTTVVLATARIDAFDAKSAESLTLIARGSGQAYDERFDALATNVEKVLADEQASRDAFARYLAVHKQIRALDTAGNYDQAVIIATANGGQNANTVFADFDDASNQGLATQASHLDDDLQTARSPLVILAWLALLAGLAAALATWRGISSRLREYR